MKKSKTRQHITAMEGIYRRIDDGHLTGRNSNATEATLTGHWRSLKAALEAGGFEEMDEDERLAARYARLERRHLTSAKV